MANVRYKQRGTKKLWAYEIRQGSKTLAYKSGFQTKKEAQINAEPILTEIRKGGKLDKHTTLPDLFQKWLDLKIIPNNPSKSTITKYKYKKNVIVEYFGNIEISKIKSSEYQKIMNLYGQRVGADSLRRLNKEIQKSLEIAFADKVMIDDFTTIVELHSQKTQQKAEYKYLHKEIDYYTVLSELKSKFDYKNSVVAYVLYLLFKTGMRYAELIALSWSDVDFKNNLLSTHIRFNTSNGEFVPPKNETSIRDVPVDDNTLLILSQLKFQQEKTNKLLGIVNKKDLVFQHYSYKIDVPNIATANKSLKLLLTSLKISPIITTKGARHTYGSVLLHKGISKEIVAKVLGHRDTNMLDKVYGHILDEKIENEFQEIKEVMKK
ncbi:site-specific integrase [Pseudolactococcus yaeyamensis]